MRSKAAIHVEHGKPLTVDEIEIPDPRADQVHVKLYSSGVCHSQLHQMHNPETPTPSLLGHEGTGRVVAVGSDVSHVKEGDLAIVTWVPKDPIRGRWVPESSGATYREEPLNGATYTWGEDSLIWGGYVIPIDEDNPTDISSIVGCAVLTGAGAVLNTARVRPGDAVAIYGIGGVGTSALIMAAMLEAYPLIAIDIDDSKLEYAKEMGATHTVNAIKTDPIEAIHDITGGGADYAFDAIGLQITSEQILPSVRGGGPGADNHGGMAVLIGMPAPQMTVDPGQFMYHQKQYRGSLGATYPEKDFDQFLRWHQEGKFPLDKLVTRRYSLDQINEACNDLQNGEILGRAIMVYD